MAVYFLYGSRLLFLLLMEMYGRTPIYISRDVNRDNVIEILGQCILTHSKNVGEINILYDYYRGKQAVLNRKKEFNDYVLNKIVENRFKEIVDFKTAFTAGNSIKYSANDQEYADAVDMLNDFCRLEGKETLDYDLVEWMNIAGTAYRLVLPKSYAVMEGESPFYMVTLDPRNAFVAYSSKVTHEPVMCCYVTVDADTQVYTYSVYAREGDSVKFYEIVDDQITNEDIWTLRTLPIIEYPHGKARLGAAEVVLPLLDAINNLDSNRLDSVEQFVQSLLVLINCKLPDGFTASTIKEMGLIELISNGENKAAIEQIANVLDQTNTQTLKEDMMQAIRDIVAMPTVSAQSSGGDNGLAVLYRNGWEGAYQSATTDEKAIDASEFTALKLMLEICDGTGVLNIPLRAINIDYTREHYENMQSKVSSLIAMLQNDKIHPKVAYEVSGLFYDPNKKYLEGLKWFEEHGQDETSKEVIEVEEDDSETQTT